MRFEKGVGCLVNRESFPLAPEIIAFKTEGLNAKSAIKNSPNRELYNDFPIINKQMKDLSSSCD